MKKYNSISYEVLDGIIAISVTYSNSLVHKIKLVKCFKFHHIKAIAHSQSSISGVIFLPWF